ncbi:MAG: hypothetical protein ACO2PN_17435 [Pyrobaculum sp.]|jgi:hypothetical protein
MELQKREFLKLGGVATVASSAFGVVHVASTSRQAVPPSGEWIVLVVCDASRFITMDDKGTQLVLVGP